ncbi:M43 family zinc metalloprotease [Pseudoalteromonas sp. MMG024]|uniref:M43 family zinc metalloprotease n=1 Tax=Pseudoalteromonas sp. MMG024 TaxID=2909980 RepID=UPI001EEC6701|nr:M43 family zinc metalloprotease [Pseudoalteromonas sp. MMG024]MCF6458573.1 PKD domain-containing protein [Pseudoalteromonas sp. MMG024]
MFNKKKCMALLSLALTLPTSAAFAGSIQLPSTQTQQLLFDNKKTAAHICGTDDNHQDWRALQKLNKAQYATFAQLKQLHPSAVNQNLASVVAAGNGVPGRYYIPVVVHVYGDTYNCTDETSNCLTEEKIIDALNKSNEDFLGTNTQDGPIDPLFQAIRENLNIEFVLAKKDPNGNATNGIVRYANKSGYGNGSGVDDQIAADAWDNFKYMNIYVQQDLYADGGTTSSGVAWYPSLSMSENGLARVVYNGNYLGSNTGENFRSVLTHEFGHWLNLPHTFDGDVCSVHQEAFCAATGDNNCDTPQMSSSILQNNALNCLGQKTNTENFMHYSDNYAMFTKGQVQRMTAALHGPARKSLWSNENLIATGLEEYTSSDEHYWDGSGLDIAPEGNTLESFDNLSANKGESDNFEVTIPQGTEAVAFYLDGYTEDPDLYVSRGSAPTKNGDKWNADFISFKSAGVPELVTVSAPSINATYHSTVDAFTAYTNARLQVIAVDDATLCNNCERIFLTEETNLSANKGDAVKEYQFTIPDDAIRTVVVLPGGYQGDPDMYISVDAIPTTSTFDCGPFSAPRHSEYCELPAGGGTLNVMIDPFLDYSGVTLRAYYERATNATLPIAEANGAYSAQIGESVTLISNGSSDSDGTIVSFQWDLGDGNQATGETVNHTYAQVGEYTVTLTVTDNDGNTASDTSTVTINDTNKAPIVVISDSVTAQLGESVTFSAAGSSDDGEITRFEWQLGDGTTKTGETITHTYSQIGNYTVTLTATDNLGESTSATTSAIITDIGYCDTSGNTNYEWIESITLAGTTHSSAKEGYGDFTGISMPLIVGNNSVSLTAGGNYTEHWTAYIDFNQNGTFEQSEQVIANLSGKNTVSSDLAIPASAGGITTRMRVIMKYNGAATSACGAIGDGEVEDYTVSISEPVTPILDNACAVQSPVTSGRLENGKATCLGANSTMWFSLADASSHDTVTITAGHGTGTLNVFYKNGGWPSESDNQGAASGETSLCFSTAAGSEYWSYMKVTGGAEGATIKVEYDATSCQ